MRSLPDPGFPGDDGRVSPELAAALAAYGADPAGRRPSTLAVLQHARLLVPVVAVLEEVEHDEHGRPREKSADMATVLLRGRDGRSALLAFSGSESLAQWDPEARPVPVPAARAAEAALSEGAVALVLDVAGPVKFVVGEEALRALADGLLLVDLGGRYGWVRHG